MQKIQHKLLKNVHNIILKITMQDKYHRACYIVLVVGILLKMLYSFRVSPLISEHDLGDIAPIGGIENGHIGYMQFLYRYHHLPDTFLGGQTYHPPLFHAIGAIVLQIFSEGETRILYALSVLQLVNMGFASLTTIYIYKLLNKVQIKGMLLVCLTLLISTHPVFYWMGVTLNNDTLMTMFVVMALYYTVCWIQKDSMVNILLIAISIVGALLTKTSGILIAPAVGFVFLWRLWSRIRTKGDYKYLIGQYLIFGIVCIPLGISWVLRSYLLFGLPFNYVLNLGVESTQYIGYVSLWDRIELPTKAQLFSCEIDWHYPQRFSNIWGQIMITMSFDEGILVLRTGLEKALALVTMWGNTAIYGLMGVATVLCVFQKKICHGYRILIGIGYFILVGSFVKFAFDYPHVCTMNFRYIVTTLGLSCLGTGLFLTYSKSKNKIARLFYPCIILSSIATSIIYTMCAV